MKTRVLVALAALLAAGCDTPSAIDDYTEDVRLDFTARSDWAGPPETGPELVFTGGEGEILVEGRLTTADPCQDITADAVMEGGRLRLVVRVESQPGFCIAVIGRFGYTARLLELEPGRYDLAVVHEYADNGGGTVRHETQVTVR